MTAAPAAPAVANAPVAQLCLGSGPTGLNLRVVLQRVGDLIRSIDSLLMDMQLHGAHWMAFLDKLAVINMTHMQIMQEVRPLLRQYTVYPSFVDNPGIENALPEMLASRLLPEQVEQEALWKAQMPGGLAALAAQPNVCLDYADSQVVELQELVGWLTSLAHVTKAQDLAVNPTPMHLPVGVLDPKGKLRREVDATSRQIALTAAAAEKRWTKAGSQLIYKPPKPAQPPAGAGQKRRRAAAEPLTPEQEEAEADDLVAKIMRGALWPSYRGQAAAAVAQ